MEVDGVILMTDVEMDLMLAQTEVLTLKKAIREKDDTIANLKNHVSALQTVIEKMRKQMDGDSNG